MFYGRALLWEAEGSEGQGGKAPGMGVSTLVQGQGHPGCPMRVPALQSPATTVALA